jgi:hypothetical protein
MSDDISFLAFGALIGLACLILVVIFTGSDD